MQQAWSQSDQRWAERYHAAVAGKRIPADALQQREHELNDAVQRSGLGAQELFGDAAALAADDARYLASSDEVIRSSLGGGLRPALREVGGTLLAVGVLISLRLIVEQSWSADLDVDVGAVLVAGSMAILVSAWVVARALWNAGLSQVAVGALAAAAALAVLGIASAGVTGPARVLVGDVPVPLLCLVVLAPGVLTLVAASRVPEPVLHTDWDDAQWLRRFHAGLRARLMPLDVARDHVAELTQVLQSGTAPAAELGHPLVLAHDLAEADRTSRKRRWMLSLATGSALPLACAALTLANDSWGAMTVPLAVALTALGCGTGIARWRDRRTR